jgi:hypothetical protein
MIATTLPLSFFYLSFLLIRIKSKLIKSLKLIHFKLVLIMKFSTNHPRHIRFDTDRSGI